MMESPRCWWHTLENILSTVNEVFVLAHHHWNSYISIKSKSLSMLIIVKISTFSINVMTRMKKQDNGDGNTDYHNHIILPEFYILQLDWCIRVSANIIGFSVHWGACCAISSRFWSQQKFLYKIWHFISILMQKVELYVEFVDLCPE